MSDGTAFATGRNPRNGSSGADNQRDLLLEYRERLAFATEAAQIGYWFCDLPFDRLIWDQQVKAHFWLPADAEVNIDIFYAQIHSDDRERTRQAIALAIASRERYDIEYRTVSAEGQIKWIRAIGRAAYDVTGQPVRFDGVTREITALKELEEARDRAKEALLRSEKLALVGRLAATIAHEINNPLAAVTNLLYVIGQSVTEASTLENVKQAIDEIDRVSQIVTQTLRFNRGSSHRSCERVSQIIDSALSLYDVRLRQLGVKLTRDYASEDRLFCLPSEVRQVFANLIANALDASLPNSKLIIRTRAQPHGPSAAKGIRVTVADTGSGMDRGTLLQLFQPFVSTKGENGTGLGLWVSREILNRHQATIRVRSRRDAAMSGTVFSIWIPQPDIENMNGETERTAVTGTAGSSARF